jgi:serine/threonine protein kinase
MVVSNHIKSSDSNPDLLQQNPICIQGPLPQIDNIEMLELLGKGGMSLVYRARQKQLERIVAVKVLSRASVGGEDGIKRFQKEAKLTSTLAHPNIVRIISFGVAKDGQPYLVMEYLDGISLFEHLKQNGRLRLQEFKDIFIPVLAGLGHAHQDGLIHRDIKPGNIMICRNESGPRAVKLVDFGIAKALSGDTRETLGLTADGALLGTPTYMSPEQCQGKPLDARSDLYSLACVMYESLTGEPPFKGDSPLDVMQKHSGEPAPTVSELSRKIDIYKELAAVIVLGLAKDPDARPQSASEFAAKLNEVMDHVTLDKVPLLKKQSVIPSKSVATISIAAACLMLLIFGLTFGAKHNKVDEPKPVAVSPVSIDDIKETQSKQALERAEKRFDPDSPQILEQLDDLARCYFQRKNWAKAGQHYKRALEIREKTLQPADQGLGLNLGMLSECYLNEGKFKQAAPLLKRSLEIRMKAFGPEDSIVTENIAYLMDCYRHEARWADIEPLLKPSLAAREKAGADTHDLDHWRFWLARCYMQEYKFAEARSLLKRLLAREQDKLTLAETLVCLARCDMQEGKFAQAELLLKRALAIRERESASRGADDGLYWLSICYEGQRKCSQTEQLLKHALVKAEQGTEAGTAYLSAYLSTMADCYEHQNKQAEADPILKRSLTLREQVLAEHNQDLNLLDFFAEHYRLLQKYTEEEELLKRMLAHGEKEFGSRNPNVALILERLAACYCLQGKPAMASPLRERARAIQSAANTESRLQSSNWSAFSAS